MTTLTRRTVLKGAAATALFPTMLRANPGETLLRAGAANVQLVEAEYPATQVWGFNGSVPGPTIRAPQGAQTLLRLHNDLEQSTAVHWHGLRIDNAMDGVPGMTQDAVPKGGEFLYDLTLRDAGTYWYHSHNRSMEQVARGLYGVMVVDEPDAPEVDRDLTVVLEDWRLTPEAQVSDDFGNMHDLSHAGRMGNFIQAVIDPAPKGFAPNERLRLRLVNVATDRIMPVSLRGVEGWVVARDGMPLRTPETLDMLVLGPAERVDLIVDVTAETGGEVLVVFHQRDTGYVLNEYPVTGAGTASRRPMPKPLPPNPIATLTSTDDARKVPLLMQGGAMGGLQEGRYKGKTLSMRELVAEGQLWTLNGEAGLPETPLIEVSRGETVVLSMGNDTAFPHAMHMHGTHFQEVLADGTFGTHKDTVLVNPGEARDFAFVADNPGKWLIHCHMLSHQTAGMKTWFRVT